MGGPTAPGIDTRPTRSATRAGDRAGPRIEDGRPTAPGIERTSGAQIDTKATRSATRPTRRPPEPRPSGIEDGSGYRTPGIERTPGSADRHQSRQTAATPNSSELDSRQLRGSRMGAATAHRASTLAGDRAHVWERRSTPAPGIEALGDRGWEWLPAPRPATRPPEPGIDLGRGSRPSGIERTPGSADRHQLRGSRMGGPPGIDDGRPSAPGIERTPGSCYRPPGIDDGSADIAVGNLTAFRPLGAFVSNPPTGTAAVEKRALDRRGSGPPSLKHWRSSDKTSIADHSRIVSLSGAAPPARSPAVWVGRSSSTVQRWKQELPVAPMLIAARQRRNNTRSQL